ncbi:MAG: hypothetical protein HGA80_01025 [Candidatus Omnitrophica bacterium]|nr:hypothetical protein [Candidatus Omnitrophota bacterium]
MSKFRERSGGMVASCAVLSSWLMLSSGVLLWLPAMTSPAVATEEMTVIPNEVSVQADSGKAFGDIAVEVKTNKDPEKLKIVSIRLKLGGKWLKVPEAAFADLGQPLLNRLELRVEDGYDRNPWLYVYFEVASNDIAGNFAPKRVHIAYHNGKFESRSIETPLSGGSTRWDKIKL